MLLFIFDGISFDKAYLPSGEDPFGCLVGYLGCSGGLSCSATAHSALASRLSYLVLTSFLLNLGVGAWLHKSAVSCAGWPFWVRGGVPGSLGLQVKVKLAFPLVGCAPAVTGWSSVSFAWSS
jgi:hypothetical protein